MWLRVGPIPRYELDIHIVSVMVCSITTKTFPMQSIGTGSNRQQHSSLTVSGSNHSQNMNHCSTSTVRYDMVGSFMCTHLVPHAARVVFVSLNASHLSYEGILWRYLIKKVC